MFIKYNWDIPICQIKKTTLGGLLVIIYTFSFGGKKLFLISDSGASVTSSEVKT